MEEEIEKEEDKPIIDPAFLAGIAASAAASTKKVPGFRDNTPDYKKIGVMASMANRLNGNKDIFLVGAVIGALLFGTMGIAIGFLVGVAV